MRRAKKFYSEVFEWVFEDYPMPGMEYSAIYTTDVDKKTRMPKEVGAINGGLLKRGGPWLLKTPTVAVVVPDLEKTIKKITAAGGSVIMDPKRVGEMGLYAYVKDTEGNTIGVWQSIKKPNTRTGKVEKKESKSRR